MRFHGVPKRLIAHNAVAVLTPDLFPRQDSSFFEVSDNSLDCPLGDPNFDRYLTKYHIGIARNQNQYMRMIRQKRPARPG